MERPSASGEATENRQRILASLALLCILALACALRVIDLQASLWSDEIRTYEGAVKSLPSVLTHKRYPLYFVLAHFSLLLGDTEALLRIPSVLAGVLGVLLAYFVGKTLHGRIAGLTAALLLATWEYHVDSSQRARFYALLMLAGLLMFWLLYLAVTRGGAARWTLFALAAFFGVLSHLFAVPMTLALAGGAALWVVTTRTITEGWAWPRWRRLAALALSTLLGMSGFLAVNWALGGLPRGLAQLNETRAAEHAGGEATQPVHTAAVSELANGDDEQPAGSYRLSALQYAGFFQRFFRDRPLAILVLYGVLALWGSILLWRRHAAAACMAGVLLFALPLPFFAVTTAHFYMSRYFSFLLPITLLIIAVGAADLALRAGTKIAPNRPALRTAVAAIALSVLAVAAGPSSYAALAHNYSRSDSDPWRGNWKGAAEFIARDLRSGNVLIQAIPEERHWEIDYPLSFYLHRNVPNYNVVSGELVHFHGTPAAENLDEVFAAHAGTTVWFVSKGVDYLDQPVLDTLDRAGAVHRRFGVVNVWRVGEPTENLAPWGGFEGPEAAAIASGPLELAEPEEAFSGEHALEVRLTGRDAANIALPFTPDEPGSAIAPNKAYTLSFWLRCEDVPPQDAIKIGIAGLDAKGNTFTKTLVADGNDHGWMRQTVTLDPGQDVPPDAKSLALLLQVSHHTGSVWLDNVQFEAKPYPTPFVQGRREPRG